MHNNIDRCAIKDAIFAKDIVVTHSTDQNVELPKHTILCIWSSKCQWKKAGKGNGNVDMNENARISYILVEAILISEQQ